MTTGNNEKFLRFWHEVSQSKIGKGFCDRKSASDSGMTWFPYNKGGEFRKWFGNNLHVVNWKHDGKEIIESGRAFPRSKDYYFKKSITWTATSSSYFGVRHSDHGFVFDAKGSSCFATDHDHKWLLAFLTSKQVSYFLSFLNPTIEFQTGNIASLPLLASLQSNEEFIARAGLIVDEAIAISRTDWDASEVSWEFQNCPLIGSQNLDVQSGWNNWQRNCNASSARLRYLEEENNRLFIEAYNLQGELSPEVPEEQITLYRPDRQEDIKRLLSYAIGCVMGRIASTNQD